jgi:bifunctional DNase/RNase
MMDKNKLIPVNVKKIIYFPPSKNYAIILNETGSKIQLPIIVGTFEAQAIALGIEKITMPRPMTHDLIVNFLKKENITIKKIIITKLVEGTFHANIFYENANHQLLELDSRPSDAIAIALRTNSQIYVNEKVMKEAGQVINLDELAAKTPQPNNPANNIDLLDQIHDLQIKMQEAIDKEDYESAAEFRDKIKSLESKTHN